ncbi:MAG: helix-turn-helix domain-containing protein [Actinomycetota bacterium]|nr:helix-turn-helix domain-containing protein [Actinomycetota bacterium]
MARRRGTQPPQRVVLTDHKALRALAHPARTAVIDELYMGKVRTASELAELTGLTPSAMSYHLRALEKWGIICRAEPTGDARERPWQRKRRHLELGRRYGDPKHRRRRHRPVPRPPSP